MRVLIIEDEKEMAELLKEGMAGAMHYDAVVLTLTHLGIDGLEIARRVSKGRSKTPILVLAPEDAVPDVVKGDFSGDDYMTKPVSFEEVLARLRAISRTRTVPRSTLQVRDLILDTMSHEVTRHGEAISLTLTEFRLLKFLMRRAGCVVSRRTIVHSVWKSNDDFDNNTLDAHIRNLRNKVDRNHKVKLIQTFRRFGYVIRDPLDSPHTK